MTKLNNSEIASQNWQNFMESNLFSSSVINSFVGVDFIKYPIITEKSYFALCKNQQYTFDVDLRLTKTQIKKIFEQLFNVKVIAVNTHIPPRKMLRVGTTQGYRTCYKRAILTIKKGEFLKFSIPLKAVVTEA